MKTLLDLNDDCLLEIFKYLSLVETFNLIEIHNSRLIEIAHQRIAAQKQLNIQIREFPNFTSKQLKIIGKNLHSLSMSIGYGIPTQKVINIIKPLCEGAALTKQLQKFSLNYVYFNKQYCKYIGLAVSNVEKLNLGYCQITDGLLTELLKKCIRLKELQLFGNYTLRGEFLRNLFYVPTLRVVTVELHADWTYPLEEFENDNPNIQLITIRV